MNKYKQDFPILKRRINDQPLVYLDSASTSQKPQAVIDAVVNVYKNSNANIHRGIYTISEEATKLFEETREKVAKFINAKDSSEIIFTKNTTESLNIIAYGLGQTLKKGLPAGRQGGVILISEMEHHSNIVPWQRIAKEKGARLLFIPIDKEGRLVLPDFAKMKNLKIVSLAHVSNVLGTINGVEKIIKNLRSARQHLGGVHSATPEVDEPIVVIDGAQSVPHMPVDVQKLGCDFYVFSGHKMLAPTGVGVLWGRKELLEKMEPLLVGSHMISEVTKEKASWNTLPWKFEPGTAAIEAVVGLGAAIDYLNKIGMDKIREHEKQLVAYALSLITKIDGVIVYGPSFAKASAGKGGVISFNIKGVHSHDVAQILDSKGICIRSGHHCAMPLHQKLGIDSSCRASFYLYNDERDVDRLVEGIKKVKKIFKV